MMLWLIPGNKFLIGLLIWVDWIVKLVSLWRCKQWSQVPTWSQNKLDPPVIKEPVSTCRSSFTWSHSHEFLVHTRISLVPGFVFIAAQSDRCQYPCFSDEEIAGWNSVLPALMWDAILPNILISILIREYPGDGTSTRISKTKTKDQIQDEDSFFVSALR